MAKFHVKITHKYIPLYSECTFILAGNNMVKDANKFQEMIDTMLTEIGSKQEMVDITVKRDHS